MKTWEMIKELSENPKKKFKRKTDGLEIRNMGGRFNWAAGYTFLGVNDEWEEVKEPVSPMEAIKSGKRIKVKHELLEQEIYNISEQYSELDDIMCVLSEYFQPDIADIFLNGEWYIED